MPALSASRARLVLPLLCGAALGACAVGPNYVRPTTPAPAGFKEAQGWSVAAPADTLDRGEWWTLFNDPVLNDLERKVLVSNQTLAASEAAYREARAVVRGQRAALFPTVSLDGSGSRAKSQGAGGASGGPSNSYKVDIGATWEIDVWGRIRRTVESAKASAQASEADLAGARLSAQGELAADYLQLRETDAEIALLDATVQAYARALEITQNRFQAGVAAKTDVLQAQTQLANAQAQRVGLDQQRAQLEHAIAVLVGQAPADFSIAAQPQWSQVVPDVPAVVPSQLLQRRPDIAGAERRVAAANAQIGVAEAAYFPDLSLTGTYGYGGSSLSRLFESSASFWSLGGALAETLFDGGARGAKTAQAKATYDQTVAQYRQTTLAAFQSVEDQLAASRVLAQQFDLRKQASAAADEAERLSLHQDRAGQIAYSAVITTQTAALTARVALAQAARNRQTTAGALIQALGGGWQAAPPDGAVPRRS